MTQTVSRTGGGNTPPANPRLLELLETNQLDWADPRHREMYLRAWLCGSVKPYPLKAEGGAC